MPSESQIQFFTDTLSLARTNVTYSNNPADAARAALASTKATVSAETWHSTQAAYGGEEAFLTQLVGAMSVTV